MPAHLTVLFVEDRPEDTELVLYELKRAGFQIEWECVDNEQDYVEKLDKPLDLILADYTLPQFGALRALELLKASERDIPLIVLTGTVSEEIAVNVMKQGAADYLLKDRLVRLGHAVTHALEEKTRRDQKRHADEQLRRYADDLEVLVAERTAQLERSKEHVEAILNNTSDAIILLYADGTISQTNPAFSQLFGYFPDELYGQHAVVLAAPGSEAVLRQALDSVRVSRASQRVELMAHRKNGTLLDGDVTFDRLMEGDGVRAILCTIRNITERKQMERALQESEARYRRLTENAQDTIYRFAFLPQPRFEYISPAVTKLVGYTPEEHYANPTLGSEIVHEEDRPLVAAIAAGTVSLNAPIILRWIRKDGAMIWSEHRIVPIRDEHGQMIAVEGVARDITQRQQAADELRTALEKERELNELKSRFTSMVSHEFRTPLAIIQSASDLLRHYNERMTDERRREQLDDISLQVKRLAGLLDDILAIGRVESVGLEFKPQMLRLTPLCADIAQEIARTSPRHTIEFTSNCDNDLMHLDEMLVRRIISNLLNNAVKYSPEGGTVRFTLGCDSDAVCLVVADSGIGIPPEDMPHLFTVFHRARNVGAISGSGLGLAIVKQAVDAHGGTVTCNSIADVGTTFTVLLPRVTRR